MEIIKVSININALFESIKPEQLNFEFICGYFFIKKLLGKNNLSIYYRILV